jgi:hypothetical protein
MPFTIRCNGGPAEGTRFCNRLEDYGLSWPLPEILTVPGSKGVYRKVSESQLPPEAAENPNLGVGAEYEWDGD